MKRKRRSLDEVLLEAFKQRASSMRAVCRREGLQLQDANDVLQEVFSKAWKSRRQLKCREKVTAWLLRITINQVNDFYRRRNRAPRSLAPEQYPPDPASGPPESAQNRDLRRRVNAAIETLAIPDHSLTAKKNAVRRRLAEVALDLLAGYGRSETARRLGCSEKMIERARSALRDEFRFLTIDF